MEVEKKETVVTGIERVQREYPLDNRHAGLLLRGVDANELKEMLKRGAVLFVRTKPAD